MEIRSFGSWTFCIIYSHIHALMWLSKSGPFPEGQLSLVLASKRGFPGMPARSTRRVLCCHYTPDGRFVLSGSEDTNIRVWKDRTGVCLCWKWWDVLTPMGCFFQGNSNKANQSWKNMARLIRFSSIFSKFLRFGHWSVSRNMYGCVVAAEAKADQKLGVASNRETRAEVPLLSIGSWDDRL